MAYYELSPAYGRDYKTKAEVLADWNADKDFAGDYQLGFKPVNRQQLHESDTVILRYAKSTKLVSVKVDHKPAKPVKPYLAMKQPSIATLQRWSFDGVAKATDGCTVEPDGKCEHGKPSWLIELGLI